MLSDKAGYITLSGPGKAHEADTKSCAHCQRLIVLRSTTPGIQPMLYETCRKCMRYVCPLCMGTDCEPFMRKIERMEARDRMLRSIGIGA